jgi:RNA polymerase sigma factor (sigma-70 family)
MITKLDQFKGKSRFRTWLYRIVVNHFMQSQKKKAELEIHSFMEYGVFLDTIYTEEMTEKEHQTHEKAIVQTRNSCMSSMLLCLDRQQRMVFVLGAVFNLKSNIAAKLLDMTAENFRQQLSRAKADLFQFMDNKCGLINPNNPCRCSKKTKGFIKEGKVNEYSLQFNPSVLEKISDISNENNSKLDLLIEGKYLQFFQEQPYQNREVAEQLISSMLFDTDLKQVFQLN